MALNKPMVDKVELEDKVFPTLLHTVVDKADPNDKTNLRSWILDKAVARLDVLNKVCFGILCVDEGEWPEDVRTTDSAAGLTVWARCKGITQETLKAPTLDTAACEAISDGYRLLAEAAGSAGISGVCSDLGQLWLKHHRVVRQIIGQDIPVYLSPIVQLPMISASFKSFEMTLLVTWDPLSESQDMKKHFVEESNLETSDMERLMVLGVDKADETWKAFMNWSTTAEQNQDLSERLCTIVRSRISKTNTEGKKDKLIKAIILTARLGIFSDALREASGMPVFDETTLLKFFKAGSAPSYYNDASVLSRLNCKMRPHKASEKACKADDRKLGLIKLDYSFPSTFGDMEHPGTFGFKIREKVVKDLFFDVAQGGSFEPAILENMTNVIKELEAEGVMGFTGNCGFMMHYQCFARHVATVPVFMSSLIQAATLAAAIDPAERVLILTANDETLKPGKDKLLQDSGIKVTDSSRFVILGLQNVDGFEAVANGEKVDTIKVQNALSKMIPEFIEKENSPNGLGKIGMILMECTELPHFADSLRQLTKLPVFDCVTLVNYFYDATASKNWNTKTYTPHNAGYWNTNYTESGYKK